jgi:mitofilin
MVTRTYQFITNTISGTSPPSEPTKSGKAITEIKSNEPKPVTFKVINKTITKVEPEVKPTVRENVKVVLNKAETVVKDVTDKVGEEYADLVQRAEAAIAGKPFIPAQEVSPTKATPEPVSTVEVSVSESNIKVYDVPLPLGFEPPPGFSRPPPKSKSEAETKPGSPLPLVAPTLTSASEPIITHLAATIDNLATYLKSDPKTAEQATDVLESAKSDLAALVERIEVVKEQERTTLEAKIDEQSREYTLKLMELEMEGQDKVDQQEQEFRAFFEHERARFAQAYRDKLDHELQVQTELINERYVTVS